MRDHSSGSSIRASGTGAELSPVASRTFLRGCVAFVAVLSLAAPANGIAQTGSRLGDCIREESIGPGLTVLSVPGGNLVIRSGENEVFVAGSPNPAFARALRGRIAAKSVRWAVLFYGDSAIEYGDGTWGSQGAITVAHESLRGALWSARQKAGVALRPAVPVLGFSEVMQISLSGEEAHVVHQRPGYSAADIIVHLERENVMLLGNLYVSDGYPAISLSSGGSLNGMIDVISTFVNNFGKVQGMRFVPGAGPVTSMARLRQYRDMLVTVRQRVSEAIRAGRTEEQVAHDGLTDDLDPQWGHGGLTSAEFLRVCFRSIVKDSASGRSAAPH